MPKLNNQKIQAQIHYFEYDFLGLPCLFYFIKM